MVSNRLAFAGLALACVTAAAGGSYLASRENDDSRREVAASTAEPEFLSDSRPAGAAPVQETEALVGEAPVKPAAPVAVQETPVARPAPVVREETPRAAARPRRDAPATSTRTSTPPPLERSWPSGSSGAAQGNASSSGSTTAPADLPGQTAPGEPATAPANDAARVEPPADTPAAPEQQDKQVEELTVASNSVLGLQVDTAVSTERAKVEDRVDARVVRDVRVNGQAAIPAGTKAEGSVMLVEPGGRFRERARLGIRFHTLVLPDGTRLPITTETIYRYGDAPGNASAAKIGGGAVAGAILGAIVGGAKGAAVGATAGAGGGTAAVLASDRSVATFPAGTEVTARILSPVSVTVEK